MKRNLFALSLMIVFVFYAQIAAATINYCDWETGDDDTGDGSASTPYKTIYKCTTGLTGGDECRVAKTGAHTALTGTLTFTDQSDSVATSDDLTSELTAGDFIGKNTDDNLWWRVESLTSTTITLEFEYSGTSEATTAYKMTASDQGSAVSSLQEMDGIATSGSSDTSRIKISGGWDLTGPTQNGETYFVITSATQLGIGLDLNNYSYLEISNLNYAYGYTSIYTSSSSDYVTIDDVHSFGARNGIFINNINTNTNIVKNCNVTATYAAVRVYGQLENFVARSVSYDEAVQFGGGDGLVGTLKNVEVHNMNTSTYAGVHLARGFIFIDNLTITDAPKAILMDNAATAVLVKNLTIDTVTTIYDISSGVFLFKAHNPSITNMTTERAYAMSNWTPIFSLEDGMAWYITDEDGIAGNNRGFVGEGAEVTWPFSANRSGQGRGLKLTPSKTNLHDEYILLVGQYTPAQSGKDVYISFYAKEDASADGETFFAVYQGGRIAMRWQSITLSTDYKLFKFKIDAADVSPYPMLFYFKCIEGYGYSYYLDDFSVSQPQ
jgi:hypothetical protein